MFCDALVVVGASSLSSACAIDVVVEELLLFGIRRRRMNATLAELFIPHRPLLTESKRIARASIMPGFSRRDPASKMNVAFVPCLMRT